MNIWIDLANSPQVLFFRPIITDLQRRGHSLTLTTRDYAQTTQLADLHRLRHTPIGAHGGKKLYEIVLRFGDRVFQLARFARTRGFDLALSHGSSSQAVSAFALGIPFVTLMDYEHQPANHVCFRLARRVILPEYFPDWALRKYGANLRQATRYHGLKEQVYLTDFVPQEDFVASIGIPRDRILVVMRPPASWSLYHHFENPLFEQAIEYVASNSRSYIVFLPRVPSQGESVLARGYANVWVPQQVLDGPNLLYHADLVISAGGTMNREAAVLGAPTYSLFKGKPAAVDSYLVEKGRMKHIAQEADISTIQVCKKVRQDILADGCLIQEITDAILSARR